MTRILFLSAVFGLGLAFAPHGNAQLDLAPGGDTVAVGNDTVVVIARESSANRVLSGAVICVDDSDTPSVGVVASAADPDRRLDLDKRLQILQKRHVKLSIDFFNLSGPADEVQAIAPSCQVKILGIDKDKDGDLLEGTDLLKGSLKCKKDLAADIGLDPSQTSELEAAFGNTVSCQFGGTPFLD